MSREELNQACNEYQMLLTMCEEDVCEYCNTDTKEEALRLYEEEIDYWERHFF